MRDPGDVYTDPGGQPTGQLNISANVAGGAIAVALSGSGESSGAVQLTPVTLSFGQVQVGTTSNGLQVTLENGGATALPITSVTVTAPFVLAGNACGSSLAANSDCQLTVEFAPTQAVASTGTLTLVDGSGTQIVQLYGTGAAPPTDTLSPGSLTFPGTVIGEPSAAQAVTLANSGDLPLDSITASASGPFQVSSNCGGQLAGNSSCSISVVFVPTAAATQAGTLTVADSLKTQTVALSGTGVLAPVLTASPASLSFPPQQAGAASAPLTLTVSNTGGSAMGNVGFAISGPGAGSFSTGATTCGTALNSGSSCTVQVIFTPAATGGIAATLTVTSSTLGVKAVTVALSGAGLAASGLNVSPAQMTLTEATLGQASAAQTVTVSNASSLGATGLTLAVTAPFSLTQNTCTTSLAAGATATGVVFTPTANGTAGGTLTVGTSTLNTATVILTGIGGAAGSVEFQPAQLSFSTTGVGATSNAQTVTVTNTSATALLTDLAVTISNGFQIASNTCTSTLTQGASCAVGVTFTPASAGQQTGNLTVASSALAQSVQAALSGMGLDFTSLLSGSTGQSVASGQTANHTLVLTPASGWTGTFTFKCGTLPAYSTCTFNPTSEMVPANSTGNVTVSVATGQAQTASVSAGQGWVLSFGCLRIILLPLAWRRRRRAFLLVAAGMLVIGGVSSCSGSGGGTGGAPPHGGNDTNTPPGTYSIPVSVTACGASHTVTLTLTVD